MNAHPVAEIFPVLEGQPLDELAKDILANGLHEAIVRDRNGQILDGRNRLRACEMVGVDPRFRTWEGEGSPVAYIISVNLHRRHLDSSQRSMVAAKIANMRQGERTDLEPSENLPKVSQAEAAELLNVSARSVQSAKKVREQGTPELVAAVERGEVAVSAAAKVARRGRTTAKVARCHRATPRAPLTAVEADRRKIAFRMIDAGYQVLVQELGDQAPTEAIQKLKAVRTALKRRRQL